MLKNVVPYEIKSYEDYEMKSENFFLTSVFETVMKNSSDEIIVCDSRLNIILSNSKIIAKNENILNKLRLKSNFLDNDSTSYAFSRSINTEHGRFLYKISITKIYNSLNILDGFIFIFTNISDDDKFKIKFDCLLSFLKHDLKTPLISQVMAMKLLLKSTKNNDLMPEILNSCEQTYRMVQNVIAENSMEENNYKINKKEYNIKTFMDNVLSECSNFLHSKNNIIEINDYELFKLKIDGLAVKEALINILFQVNEHCSDNSIISIDVEKGKKLVQILISAECRGFKQNVFSVENLKNEKFQKLGDNNGLFLAGCIIDAHHGRIMMKKVEKNTIIKIFLPL